MEFQIDAFKRQEKAETFCRNHRWVLWVTLHKSGFLHKIYGVTCTYWRWIRTSETVSYVFFLRRNQFRIERTKTIRIVSISSRFIICTEIKTIKIFPNCSVPGKYIMRWYLDVGQADVHEKEGGRTVIKDSPQDELEDYNMKDVKDPGPRMA